MICERVQDLIQDRPPKIPHPTLKISKSIIQNYAVIISMINRSMKSQVVAFHHPFLRMLSLLLKASGYSNYQKVFIASLNNSQGND